MSDETRRLDAEIAQSEVNLDLIDAQIAELYDRRIRALRQEERWLTVAAAIMAAGIVASILIAVVGILIA